MIGMDPHKRSVTIEVMTADETVVGGGRFGTDGRGLPGDAGLRRRRGRTGCGRSRAAKASAGTSPTGCWPTGEDVVDVPAKLSARARVFATGQGRKTDATDAHSIALVGTRMAGLRPVVSDEQLEVLRLLVDRRRPIGRGPHPHGQPAAPAAAGTDARRRQEGPVRRPGQHCWPGSARATPVGKTRKRVAPSSSSTSSGSTRARRPPTRSSRPWSPRPAPRCWTCTASAPPVPPGCWSRSATSPGSPTATTSRPGPAPHPIDASSGDHVRHRLSRGGNRQINRVLHIMATVQLRTPPKAGPTTTARRPPGKTSKEAMRCLKRRLSDIVYRTMLDDSRQPDTTE